MGWLLRPQPTIEEENEVELPKMLVDFNVGSPFDCRFNVGSQSDGTTKVESTTANGVKVDSIVTDEFMVELEADVEIEELTASNCF